MPRGGKRVGAGRRQGSKAQKTLEQEELLGQFRARVAHDFQPVLDALFQAALGVSHLMAKDRRDGRSTVE